MIERSVAHATFTIVRSYSASPTRVYQAFADPEAKQKWFVGPDAWLQSKWQSDFRVGGIEVNVGGKDGGRQSTFTAIYQDILPERRIVYSYDMCVDGTRISVSLATIEFEPEGPGTKLTLTEQGAFLDGHDDIGAREHGTRELLAQLGRLLDTRQNTTMGK